MIVTLYNRVLSFYSIVSSDRFLSTMLRGIN
jgi:hypothetical protein